MQVDTNTTPNMNLAVPIPDVCQGDKWAVLLQAIMSVIDSHDHTSGNGVTITSTGINVNVDLTFNGNNAISLRTVRMNNNSVIKADVTDIDCIQVVNGDLFYTNAAGQQVQITSGAGINAASIGAIGGDYSGSGASLAYNSLTKIFSFLQSAGVAAKILAGEYRFYQEVAGGKYCALKIPAAGVGADFTIQLPVGLPTGTKLLKLNNSGQMTTDYLLDAEIQTQTISMSKIKQLVYAKQSIASYTGIGASVNAVTTAPIAITSSGRPMLIEITPDNNSTLNFVGLQTLQLNMKVNAGLYSIVKTCPWFNLNQSFFIDPSMLSNYINGDLITVSLTAVGLPAVTFTATNFLVVVREL